MFLLTYHIKNVRAQSLCKM